MVSWAYYFNNVTRFVHHAEDYGNDEQNTIFCAMLCTLLCQDI